MNAWILLFAAAVLSHDLQRWRTNYTSAVQPATAGLFAEEILKSLNGLNKKLGKDVFISEGSSYSKEGGKSGDEPKRGVEILLGSSKPSGSKESYTGSECYAFIEVAAPISNVAEQAIEVVRQALSLTLGIQDISHINMDEIQAKLKTCQQAGVKVEPGLLERIFGIKIGTPPAQPATFTTAPAAPAPAAPVPADKQDAKTVEPPKAVPNPPTKTPPSATVYPPDGEEASARMQRVIAAKRKYAGELRSKLQELKRDEAEQAKEQEAKIAQAQASQKQSMSVEIVETTTTLEKEEAELEALEEELNKTLPAEEERKEKIQALTENIQSKAKGRSSILGKKKRPAGEAEDEEDGAPPKKKRKGLFSKIFGRKKKAAVEPEDGEETKPKREDSLDLKGRRRVRQRAAGSD